KKMMVNIGDLLSVLFNDSEPKFRGAAYRQLAGIPAPDPKIRLFDRRHSEGRDICRALAL
ncbi:hypothetical protein, partial [Klebsiella pneumoniae]